MNKQIDRSPCPHCGLLLMKWHADRHIASCMANEATAERVRAFLHKHDKGGCIMSKYRYEAMAPAHNLPGADTLIRFCGVGWKDVADWAGLDYDTSKRGNLEWKRSEQPPQRIGPEPERAEEFRRFEGMPARPGVLVRAAWDIGAKRYVPCAAETGWCRLW